MEKTVNISGRQGVDVVPGQAQAIGQRYAERHMVIVMASGNNAVNNALRAILVAGERWIKTELWLHPRLVEQCNPDGSKFVSIRMDVSALDQTVYDQNSTRQLGELWDSSALNREIASHLLSKDVPRSFKLCPTNPAEHNMAIKAITTVSKLVLGRTGHDLYVAPRYSWKPLDRDECPPIELIVIPVKHR